MAKREKFGQRIYNACRALRGEPWPQVFQFANPPMMKVDRPDIKTLFVEMDIPELHAERMDPDYLRKVVTDSLSEGLARTLAAEGAFVIDQENREAWDSRDRLYTRYIRYTGRLRVVMPEKKEGQL